MNRKIIAGLVIAGAMIFGINAGAADWETDFKKASTNAAASGKYMLLDFSGSDWCGWCKKLDAEVFSTPDFKNYAKDNLVCVLVDFPQKKEQSKELKAQNVELAKKYQIQGYPSVIILAPDGSIAGRTGYKKGGAQAYIEHLKTIIEEYKKQTPAQK